VILFGLLPWLTDQVGENLTQLMKVLTVLSVTVLSDGVSLSGTANFI